MDKPIRVQRSRAKGWKMPENTVYVGRPTRWGNPFAIEHLHGRWYLMSRDYNKGTDPSDTEKEAAQKACLCYRAILSEALKYRARKELRGKNLACFCPLDQPCHADILLEIVNQ
jgi:hypothetical protein